MLGLFRLSGISAIKVMAMISSGLGVVKASLIRTRAREDIFKIKAVLGADIPKEIWKVRIRQRVLRELRISKMQESFSGAECIKCSLVKWYSRN